MDRVCKNTSYHGSPSINPPLKVSHFLCRLGELLDSQAIPTKKFPQDAHELFIERWPFRPLDLHHPGILASPLPAHLNRPGQASPVGCLERFCRALGIGEIAAAPPPISCALDCPAIGRFKGDKLRYGWQIPAVVDRPQGGRLAWLGMQAVFEGIDNEVMLLLFADIPGQKTHCARSTVKLLHLVRDGEFLATIPAGFDACKIHLAALGACLGGRFALGFLGRTRRKDPIDGPMPGNILPVVQDKTCLLWWAWPHASSD